MTTRGFVNGLNRRKDEKRRREERRGEEGKGVKKGEKWRDEKRRKEEKEKAMVIGVENIQDGGMGINKKMDE